MMGRLFRGICRVVDKINSVMGIDSLIDFQKRELKENKTLREFLGMSIGVIGEIFIIFAIVYITVESLDSLPSMSFVLQIAAMLFVGVYLRHVHNNYDKYY